MYKKNSTRHDKKEFEASDADVCWSCDSCLVIFGHQFLSTVGQILWLERYAFRVYVFFVGTAKARFVDFVSFKYFFRWLFSSRSNFVFSFYIKKRVLHSNLQSQTNFLFRLIYGSFRIFQFFFLELFLFLLNDFVVVIASDWISWIKSWMIWP